MMAAIVLMAVAIASTPKLGVAEGACRQREPGPAILVSVAGLKDRAGMLRLELYPDDDAGFLADDNQLIKAGKTFARADLPVAPAGPVSLCIRVPQPGRYALSLLHDRDANLKFGMLSDGIGFPGNPRLGWSKPRAAEASIVAGPGITHTTIVLNYRHGFGMRPLEKR
jgi:uncharacterized protein (DUF2141 family)